MEKKLEMTNSDADSDDNSELRARLRCFDREPAQGYKYFLLLGCTDGDISYYSKGVAWAGNEELRAPRLVKATQAAEHYRVRGVPLAIINSCEDFEAWMLHWRCHALVEKNIWQALTFKS